MNKGEFLYNKAQEYKQKYLFNKKNNKKLFTDSYREKTKNYLKEAADNGHAQAAYELAIYYSNGTFEATTFKQPDNIYTNYGYGKYELKAASDLGHVEACYEYAMYLLVSSVPDEDRHQQALKTLKNGREQDYIPLALYYAEMNKLNFCYPISDNNKNKKNLFELLDQHKPQLNEKFIQWEFNIEYLDGLIKYNRLADADNIIKFINENISILEKNRRHYFELCSIKFYQSAQMYNKAIELCKKINSVKTLEILDSMAMQKQGISLEEVFELYKEKLFSLKTWSPSEERKLPTNNDEMSLYDYYEAQDILEYIGNCFWNGRGVPQDKGKAFPFYRYLCDRRGICKWYVADCYFNGYGTPKNYQLALEIYEELAQPPKYPTVTIIDGVVRTDVQFYKYEEERAKCYYHLQMYDKAFPLYFELNQNKYKTNKPLWLLHDLGWMYFCGKGCEVNYQEAKKLFELGSKQNNAYCYNMLGLCAIHTKNIKEAYQHFVKSYKLNPQPDVEYNIARCYEFGYGVNIDLDKAKEWYEKSDAHKYSYAKSRVREVNKKIEKRNAEKKEAEEMEKLKKAMEEFEKSAKELQNVVENGGADAIANAIVQKKEEKGVVVKETKPNARKELDALIGLNGVKEKVEELEAEIIDYNRRIQRGLPASKTSMHMVFTGNAGTGKTTVARIIADILKANGVVSKGQLIETDRAGLIGEYIGETGQKTRKVVESAIGGVLFIDEAYALAPKDYGKDYGQEAIAILLKMMEDHKDDLVVIVAGYKTEMKDFIDANPGLKSRFTTYIDFPDYKENELTEIFKLLASKDENVLCEDCFEKLNQLWKQAVQVENFGNGRAVRNIYNDVIRRRSRRLRKISSPTNEEMLTILPEDIPETFVYEIK